MMTQKTRKNGKNGPSHRNTVSMTKPSADMVTQFSIQYRTNPPWPYLREKLTRNARETSEYCSESQKYPAYQGRAHDH